MDDLAYSELGQVRIMGYGGGQYIATDFRYGEGDYPPPPDPASTPEAGTLVLLGSSMCALLVNRFRKGQRRRID